MPLSRRPVAWLASLAVLMNLFVVPLSQALTTQERASLLLGGFCSTSSDSLLRLKLGAALKDIDLPDDHESLAPHLCCCAAPPARPDWSPPGRHCRWRRWPARPVTPSPPPTCLPCAIGASPIRALLLSPDSSPRLRQPGPSGRGRSRRNT